MRDINGPTLHVESDLIGYWFHIFILDFTYYQRAREKNSYDLQ